MRQATAKTNAAMALTAMVIVLTVALVYSHDSQVRTFTDSVFEPLTTTITIAQGTETLTAYDGDFTGVGNCTATSYFIGDIAEMITYNVTTTSGTRTITFRTSSFSSPHVETENSSTFSTTTFSTFTVGTTYTSTSDEDRCDPSGCWVVTLCTYSLETG